MGIFGNDDRSYYNKASGKFRKGEYYKAIDYYDKALNLNPNYVIAWNDKGASLARLKKFDDALICYDKALEINPDFALSLINKSSIMNKFQRFEEAIVLYNKLLQLDENTIKKGIKGSNYKYPQVLYGILSNKGLSLNRLKKYDESILCYDEILKKNPKYKVALHNKKITQIEKQLFTKGDTIYIDNYAKKYADNFTGLYPLKELLESKGHIISAELLMSLIKESVENQDYIRFKEKILYNSPENIYDYIDNYLEMYGESYTDKIPYLKKLIIEQKFCLNEIDLTNRINNRKKELELINFEKNLLNDEVSISIYEIDELSGYEFEVFTKILFENMGYESYNTKLSGDQGADLVLKKFGEITVVQAKRYNNKITNTAIQEVVASIKHYNAHKGAVITNNEFTDSAIELANSNNIKLIDRPNLIELIDKHPISKTNLEKLI